MACISDLARSSLRRLPIVRRTISSISACKPWVVSSDRTMIRQWTSRAMMQPSLSGHAQSSGLRGLYLSACTTDEGFKVSSLSSVVLKGEVSPGNLGMVGSISGVGLNEKFGLGSGQQVRWSGSLKAKGKPRGPLWRQRKGVSKEALQVVFELKRCKGDKQKERSVLNTSAARLLKMDLLMVLVELRRQDECSLAKQVFAMVRKEDWYKPDIFLYREMMDTLGKNKLIEDVETLVKEMQTEGIEPNAMILTEFMGAYIRCGNVDQAYQVYEQIKQGDLKPDYITYDIMCRGLKKTGDFERLKVVMEDCAVAFPDDPPPFAKLTLQ